MPKELCKFIGKYINGIPVQELEPALKEFEKIENENNRIYSIMEKRIFPFLLEHDVEPIIISGSPQEPIELYKKRMGFEKAYCLRYRIDNGKYTDECIVNTAIGNGKTIILQEFLRKVPCTRILFGFGDSEADIPLLSSARQSFINNSTKFFNKDNAHYFDFNSEQAGDQIIELMIQTLEKLYTRGVR